HGGEVRVRASSGAQAVVDYILESDPAFAELDPMDRERVRQQVDTVLGNAVTRWSSINMDLEPD
ncbi:MAG: hypothetical protein ACRD0U_14145, partial [Acidimicrobiales bacterium]